MIDENDPKVAHLESAARSRRREFLGWQCRIRQLAMRQSDGRPGPGMRPGVISTSDEAAYGHIIVLIRHEACQDATARFQHMVRTTRDPAERREGALRYLAAAFYQQPDAFSDQLTALFGPASEMAARLLAAGACRLDFEQYGQRYRLACTVSELQQSDDGFQFTYWHNSLFNPAIPAGVRILGFQPDWSVAPL